MSRVKITTFVPPEDGDKIRQALGDAGAGQIGAYTYCSYTVVGVGRFLPSTEASPTIGEPGKHEEVQEERVEVVCERSKAKEVIRALKEAHPYEEVAFDIMPLIEEEEL